MRYDCYEMARPKCYETVAEKQKAYRLRKKGLPFLKEEAVTQTDKPRIEIPPKEIPKDEDSGSMLCSACGGYEEHREGCGGKPKMKEEILRGLRQAIEQESGIEPEMSVEAIESMDTRSRSDIAMGIWRNDQGGVISKFAYDKLQRLKEHAKEKEFEIDDYSQ